MRDRLPSLPSSCLALLPASGFRLRYGRGVTYDPSKRSVPELLADWAGIMRQLRLKNIVRTSNNPAGDIAEAVVAAHYEGERGSFSQAGWDVRTKTERIQVKALRRTAANTKRTNLSPIRDTAYDAVVIVVFDEDFRIDEGVKVSRGVVEELFPHREHVNGRIITVTKNFLADPRVESVDLSGAYAKLHAS